MCILLRYLIELIIHNLRSCLLSSNLSVVSFQIFFGPINILFDFKGLKILGDIVAQYLIQPPPCFLLCSLPI